MGIGTPISHKSSSGMRPEIWNFLLGERVDFMRGVRFPIGDYCGTTVAALMS